MSNLTELRALRAEIMTSKGFNTIEANEFIAGLLVKSPLTVNGWFNRSQLTPINDNLLIALTVKWREHENTMDITTA